MRILLIAALAVLTISSGCANCEQFTIRVEDHRNNLAVDYTINSAKESRIILSRTH